MPTIPSRRFLRRLRVYWRSILAILAIVFVLDAFAQVCARPPTRRESFAGHSAQGSASVNATVFIASTHRNTEEILRSTWNDGVMALVELLGPANVHFAAVESGSQDGTKQALTELAGRLDEAGVTNTIRLGLTVWEQLDELNKRPDPDQREPGWIWNAEEARFDLRRIPYLAKVRNEAMEPLRVLEQSGRHFNRVLWLNDVVFDVEDFVSLLDTRGGRYAAACSIDFQEYPRYYDTFALRDEQGSKTISSRWPWFASSKAREAARVGEPVKVFSCWNGMVLFDSAPFYAQPPLRFRGIDDSLADLHLEASECCLIHADNVLSMEPDKGVWLNPSVRVAYSADVYRQVKGGTFPSPVATIVGVWIDRLSRLKTRIQLSLERRTVKARVEKWKYDTPADEPSRTEVGEPCLINEMQIMWQNGWKHLR